jgi:hypothetical protein
MVMILGSVLAMRAPVVGRSPPDDNGAGQPLGECGGMVSVRLFLAISQHVRNQVVSTLVSFMMSN